MALWDYKLEMRNIQYYYTRKKNPDIVVILTDTNFPVTFCLFYSVLILYKELVRYSVQWSSNKPKVSICLVPGKFELFHTILPTK